MPRACNGRKTQDPVEKSRRRGLHKRYPGYVISKDAKMGFSRLAYHANRSDSLKDAVKKTWARAGFRGFYQGLIPWAWIEASTKGAILVLTSTEVEYYARSYGLGHSTAGVLGVL
ncbi:putative mitochondrial carrier C83.13 [Colletotrichum liriopes]|uniref:Mitochondrial carrier C83.13 n=1 Tax=Colletotrichum liriopes TaxID=708192 RepID=A0AA37GYW7_9PEZI|nr:putative mitochondrial carrier C83.13 [Colletotrichum liriopes]